jgi:hypothetical protein
MQRAAAWTSLMSFPLSKVTRLSDYEGAFVLSVRCTRCAHEQPITARQLAKKTGRRDALVTAVAKRLRCSQCGSRDADVRVVGIPR